MHPSDRTDGRGGEWLCDAIAERASITLQIRTKSGWAVGKSRLLAGDGDSVTIAYPQELEGSETNLAVGQLVGISFRHGHKKCVFDSEVISQNRETGALDIRRPREIQELQRRLYSRARVPDHLTIPVNVSRLRADGAADTPSMPRRGILLDLSAGGMSVAVPADARHKWRPGDTMRCLLPLEPAQEPRELTAHVRFVEKAPQGHLRMGMQFVGLEASDEGRATLKFIARAASRFRDSAGRGDRRV